MSSVTDLDFDAWRTNYDSMTFADQVAFYEQVAELYPLQESFNIGGVQDGFDRMKPWRYPFVPRTVVELGGWNGKLASVMLERDDVGFWTNYDLVRVPQCCLHPGYRMVQLKDWMWNKGTVRADVFIATHTIEHIKARELDALVSVLDVEWVYLEAPLGKEPMGWLGYMGSHVLEVGWDGVSDILEKYGYIYQHGNLWHRGGWGRLD